MFDMELTGFQRVGNRLRALASDMDEEIVDPIMEDWVKDMRHTLKGKPYPAKRQGQRYIRTGRLANSWRTQHVKSGVWGIINQATGNHGQKYAFRVVGDNKGDNQAWMHKGRWWLAYDAISGYIPDLRRRLTKALESYWEDNG